MSLRPSRWLLALLGMGAALLLAAPPGPAGSAPALQLVPSRGPVGTRVRVEGRGFPPLVPVTLLWETVDGAYRMRVDPANVVFYGYTYAAARHRVLGRVRSDRTGQIATTVVVPEDFGDLHAVDALVESAPAARAWFRVMLSASLAPRRGPVGTPIAITIRGIPSEDFKNTMALTYDNHYTGFVSAVTTHGTARVRIRAAGPVGLHVIDLRQASQATPYLNLQQSPNASFPVEHSWTFTVTRDDVLPPERVEWPAPDRLGHLPPSAPRTTLLAVEPPPGTEVAVHPGAGPVGTPLEITARGLRPGKPVQVLWMTASRGNRVTGRGWAVVGLPAARALPDSSGAWATTLTVPADLGGWHTLQLLQGGQVVGHAPFFVTRSLLRVAPLRVREGQVFTVEITGVGWTELDNGVAVTYDNAYTGFACGFNSRGDVTLHLRATGGPGVHLVDLYPMIYQGHGEPPWSYQVPQLTALEDAPGLSLGYALPIFRVAVQVVR